MSLDLFNEPADLCGFDRWTKAEKSTFLLWLSHVMTAPRSEKEAVRKWRGLLRITATKHLAL